MSEMTNAERRQLVRLIKYLPEKSDEYLIRTIKAHQLHLRMRKKARKEL